MVSGSRPCSTRTLRSSSERATPLMPTVQYNTLAEAEELRAVAHAEDDWHFDRFGLMDGVVVPAPSEGPSILASPRLAPMVISDFCPRPQRTGIGLER